VAELVATEDSLESHNVSGQDRTSAMRRAGKLVDFARDVLQR
jgi:hypothetical protein